MKWSNAYAVLYTAEQIINWRAERVNGRNVLTLLVLKECGMEGTCISPQPAGRTVESDPFETKMVEQIRVRRLVVGVADESRVVPTRYEVEVWQRKPGKGKRGKTEWAKIETRIPLL
jgi:hypothetical protein